MARAITDFDGTVVPVDADYPSGDIKDNPSGTVINRKSNSDIQQLMQKMMREAAITPSGLPDNDSNGYQLYDAINILSGGGVWADISSFGTDWAGAAGNEPRYKKKIFGSTVFFAGVFKTTGTSPDQIIGTLPSGFRPSRALIISAVTYNPFGPIAAPICIGIDPSGAISITNTGDVPAIANIVIDICVEFPQD